MNPNIAGNHLESDPPWVMEAYGTYDLNVHVFYIEKISPSERKNGQNETVHLSLSLQLHWSLNPTPPTCSLQSALFGDLRKKL